MAGVLDHGRGGVLADNVANPLASQCRAIKSPTRSCN